MKTSTGNIQGRAIMFEEYAAAIKEEQIVSRSEMAEKFEVSYTTAAYHLDRAVMEGALVRQHGYASENQPGWVYMLPETLEQMKRQQLGLGI